MNLKQDLPEQSQFSKLCQKRFYCPQHGQKYSLKCGYQHCINQLLCNSPSCLQSHFHHQNQGKLILTKFDTSEYTKKFGELQRVLTKQDFSSESKQLKSFVDELKLSMVVIYKEYKELHTRKEQFAADLNKPIDLGMMEKVQETINIGYNLRKLIDTMKSKVNLNYTTACMPIHQKQDNGLKSPSAIQSPSLSSRQQRISFIEHQQKHSNGKGSPRQYEQGEIINEKNVKENNNIIPIDLENSIDQNPVSKPQSVQGKSTNSEQKYIPTLSKPQSIKDSFEELFQTSSNKNKQKQNTQLLTPQKLADFRTFLQNIDTNGHQNGGIKNGNNSPYRSQNVQNCTPTNQQIQKTSKSDTILHQYLKIYERDFFLKKQLTIFLEQRIKNFSWGTCQQIYSSYVPQKPVEKFHELLQGRRCLLFIFVGQNRLLGSYYPSRYPRIVQKLRNDPNSFLFVSNNEQSKILEYKAVSNEFHLSVSDRLHICHGNTPSYADGIRTIQRNMNELNFYLPSVSYKYSPEEGSDDGSDGKVLSGFLKLKEFFVLQISGADTNGSECN